MLKFNIMLAAAMLAAVPAMAADPDGPKARVLYGDLDLSHPAGRTTFQRRLNHAVRAVCPASSGVKSVREMAESRRCRSDTMAAVDRMLAQHDQSGHATQLAAR